MLERWTQGPLEKRKLLAYLDRIPLHVPLSEAMQSLPPLLRISQDVAAEARDYLLLISSMVPKKGSDANFQTEVQELLRELPKTTALLSEDEAKVELESREPWPWRYLLSPSMAGSMGVAVAMYFVLKWMIQ